MNHYVYLTTNLVNDKKYIGKHSTDKMVEDDDYFGSGVLISKAISKYGKKNFRREILHYCNSEEEAFNLEIKEIKERNAIEDSKYYNLAFGGEGILTGSVVAPGDFKKHPEIYNPRKYISEINRDFDKAKGRTLFKLKYYCLYLRLNGFSKQIAKDILIEISKKAQDKYLSNAERKNIFLQELVEQIYDLSKSQIVDFIGNTKITLYNSELNRISKIKQDRLKRIAFGTLVYYKLKSNSNNDYITLNNAAICQLSKLSVKKQEREDLIKRLSEIGCIDILGKNYRIPYCIKENDCDIYKTISSYAIDENIYLLLKEYEGNQNISTCKKCGSFIINNKNKTRKYCDYCSTYNIQKFKIKKCCDCGNEYVVSAYSRTIRCKTCLYNERKRINRERKYQYRHRICS